MNRLRLIIPIVFIITLCIWSFQTLRSVFSADTVHPVITAESDSITVSAKDGDEALLEGITATDNRDGDLTSEIIITDKKKLTDSDGFEVSYIVYDSSNNSDTITRIVYYDDYKEPDITLTKAMILDIGESFSVNEYISAEDSIDGDLSDSLVTVSDSINTEEAGLYSVTVSVENSNNMQTQKTFPVYISGHADENLTVTLKDSLVYVKSDQTFSPEDYLESLVTQYGEEGNIDYLTIDNPVNLSEPGYYFVKYTYRSEDYYGSAVLEAAVYE